MQVIVNTNENINGTLILPLWQDSKNMADGSGAGVHRSLKNQIENILANGDFKAKAKSTMTLIGGEGGKAMLVGLGKEDDADLHAYRKAGAAVVAARKKAHGTDLTVRFSGAPVDSMGAFGEGMMLRDYSYDNYKMKDDEDDEADLLVRITCDEGQEEELEALINIHEGVVSGVHLSRDLGNCPPNDMYPEAFADMAWEWAKDYDNVKVTIINYEQAVKAGMGGLVAVGMGSSRKPCMVIYEMNHDVEGRCPLLVGKGITFDTGGISIKPSPSMDEMKYDMHGSATTFGVMKALAASGHKDRVIGMTCMAENIFSFFSPQSNNTIRNISENDEQQRVKRRRTPLIFFASAIFFLRRSEDKR